MAIAMFALTVSCAISEISRRPSIMTTGRLSISSFLVRSARQSHQFNRGSNGGGGIGATSCFSMQTAACAIRLQVKQNQKITPSSTVHSVKSLFNSWTS